MASKHPEDQSIVQHTQIQIRNTEIGGTDGLTTMLFEVGLMLEEEEDPDLSAPGLPPYHRLLPQKIVWDIVSMGGWLRNGVPIQGVSTRVEFDDVEDWWGDICNEAEQIPQVIVGSALSGDLPVVPPDTVAAVLSGFANVYHASSLATMEKMNEVMSTMRAPQGSVRLLLSNPSSNSKQPLYTGDRIHHNVVLIDGREERRLFEVDVFLRLAKRSLAGKIPDWEGVLLEVPAATWTERVLKQKEKERFEAIRAIDDLSLRIMELESALANVDDAYHSVSEENHHLKESLSVIRVERDDQHAENESLKEEMEVKNDLEGGYKASLTEQKKKIKDLKRRIVGLEDLFGDLQPILERYVKAEGLSDSGALLESLQSKLFDSEEEREGDEDYGYDSVVSVLRRVRESMGDKFLIGKSAINSAEASKFRFPRRVMEAFETMAKSFDHVLNRASSNQSLNYSQIFRKYGDTAFEVAERESRATMKKHSGTRDFEVDGRKVEMQPHIKIGNRKSPDRCLRIHFTFDREKQKFLIGHCGRHLPIAKS